MDAKSGTTMAAKHRAWNYWFDDGLPTIVGGLGCVTFGVSFILDHSLFRPVLVALYSVILLRNRPIIDWLTRIIRFLRSCCSPAVFASCAGSACSESAAMSGSGGSSSCGEWGGVTYPVRG